MRRPPASSRRWCSSSRATSSGAIAAARAATDEEPTNWRTWLVLSRLEAQAGNAEASVEAYRRGARPEPALAAVPMTDHDCETDLELDEIDARLKAERAVPGAAFRGELRRKLLARRRPATGAAAGLAF